MRGRVAAILLLLSSFSLDSSGQCAFTPRYSGQFRATVFDVAVDGGFLWTATGYGVQLIENGEVVDAVAIPGSTRVIASRGDGLAYAGSGSRIVVLRRNGRSIEVIRDATAPGVVNEIVVAPSHLFVATRDGIAQYDLIDPASPSRTSAVLSTSRQNVTSLVLNRDTLYAADGDSTVEVFNVSIPSLPQRTGSLETTLSRAGAVHVGTEGFIYVSDEIGQNTEVFGGTGRIARLPYGSTSFASTTTGALLVAGGDRTLRALDLSDPARPAELFERQLAPTGGTSNGIFELVRSGNTLYVAAGDIGLLTFDVSTLTLPYPMLSYAGGATTSALVIEGSVPKAYFTSGSTIVETSLQLATLRGGFNPGSTMILHDSRGSDLLVSSANTVSFVSFETPPAFSATFRAAVTSAGFIANDTVMALLADQSVWTVKTTAGATPQQLDLGGAKISYLTRSGSSYALAQITDEGQTVLHLPSKKLTVDGAATGGLALNATHAAFFTFRGLNLVDLAGGAVTVLPDSTGVFPKQLLFAGTDLLVLGERTLAVWDTTRGTLTRAHPLPANAVRMHAGAQRAVIATDEGMLVISYLARLPEITSEPQVNRYYTKAVAGRDHLYLFGNDGVDVYSTVLGSAPHFVTAVREPGLIDVAASADTFYTLGGDGAVTAYSSAGAPVAQTFVTPSPDARPDAIFTAAGAVLVAVSRGCGSGACVKNTLVLDPRTLAQTAQLDGGVIDIAVAGTRAYAILDLPSEIAVFDVADPLHPVKLQRIDAPAALTSIAATAEHVYAAGEKAYAYSTALALLDEDPQAPISRPEVEAAGDCVYLIGWSEQPDLLGGTMPLIEIPSAARSIASQPGKVYFLTEHSIEVWTLTDPPPARRRSAR